jgi:DNA polymerase-3 subunit epsilon
MNNIVVFDLETTGLDRTKDFIIQFAAIKIDRNTNKVIDTINLYVRPPGNFVISNQAKLKHGITEKALQDKPFFSEVAQQIVDFFEGCDILTYNGNGFDIPFLKHEFERIGIDYDFMKHNCYDAFLEEKRRNGNTLEDTYKRYKGKSMQDSGLSAHDALSDVKATYSVFFAQQRNQPYGPEKMLGEDNSINMMEFQGKKVPCFNIGKYKLFSVDYICKHDKNYVAWCLSDKCNFTKSTKDIIKTIFENGDENFQEG